MVKQDFSIGKSVYPPLDSIKILWNFDPEVTRSYITKATVGPLIDKSIIFLKRKLYQRSDGKSGWKVGKATLLRMSWWFSEGCNTPGGLCRIKAAEVCSD